MVQLLSRITRRPDPTDGPPNQYIRTLVETAEHAVTNGMHTERAEAVRKLVLYTAVWVSKHRQSAHNALVVLCASGTARPAELMDATGSAQLARTVCEFQGRFWRHGNPRRDDLLMLAFGFGMVPKTALAQNEISDTDAARVRQKMASG